MENKKCENGVCEISEERKNLAKKMSFDGKTGPETGNCILVFGKVECPLCKKAKNSLGIFSEKHSIFPVTEYDLETIEGLSKAAYHNALDIPVIIVIQAGKETHRWKGEACLSIPWQQFQS